MIHVLIADDHAIVRQGLKQIIDDTSDLKVVEEMDNGKEVFARIMENDIDVVVLDISMPGRNGIEILKDIKKHKPEIPVLILSMHPEEHYALRSIRAGASGYLTKKSAPKEIITAINTVISGQKFISEALAQQLASEYGRSDSTNAHTNLSDREYQVMCMIASGKTVSDIAEELALSVQSVSTYRSRILEKMNMKNNSELTYYAIKNGLVD